MDEETQRQLKVRDDLIISLERENLLREKIIELQKERIRYLEGQLYQATGIRYDL